MKKSILLAIFLAPLFTFSQNFKLLATDGTGDDHSFGMDATELAYTLSTNQDSLYVRITHDNSRKADFGFALALDTNLNPNDGAAINQTNMVGSPNTSMKYDILLYAYQNGAFPTVYTEAYAAGSPVVLNYELDTADPNFSIFRIPLAALGGHIDFNLIGFTGNFDISASGPSDAVPNSTFSQIRESHIGLEELAPKADIYPNPAQGHFKIDYTGPVKIFNLTGELVMETVVISGVNVKCSNLKPALYLLVIEEYQLIQKLYIY